MDRTVPVRCKVRALWAGRISARQFAADLRPVVDSRIRVRYLPDMSQLLDVDGVIAHLRARCETLGSQQAFANKHGLSKQYVNDVILRRRAPGKAILAALKIDHVDRYILRSS